MDSSNLTFAAVDEDERYNMIVRLLHSQLANQTRLEVLLRKQSDEIASLHERLELTAQDVAQLRDSVAEVKQEMKWGSLQERVELVAEDCVQIHYLVAQLGASGSVTEEEFADVTTFEGTYDD